MNVLVLRYRWLVLLVVMVIGGCGGGRETGQVVQPPPLDAKIILERIAETGQLAANQQQLEEELLGLGESHPEKAETLSADYQQLKTLSDPAAIKAKASEMAGKL